MNNTQYVLIIRSTLYSDYWADEYQLREVTEDTAYLKSEGLNPFEHQDKLASPLPTGEYLTPGGIVEYST